ncbi:MAG TPA: ion transporter [Aestuariivirgaceae bacterium]|nr:ion transporter [Aestuariivirgaceae bacterium]
MRQLDNPAPMTMLNDAKSEPSVPKRWLYNQLEAERPHKRGLSPVNWGLLFLILLSLVLYTAETEEEIGLSGSKFFSLFNVAILAAFALEFVLRLYAVGVIDRYRGWRGQFEYVKSHWFMITVDFIAFAPELFLLAIGINAPSWLRMFRVVRLFKMARYFPAFQVVGDAIKSCAQELLAALSISVVLWYGASVLLYIAEGAVQPENFGSISRSMWWSVVTLTTVGYGDSYPITTLGQIFAGVIAILGIGAVALPSGILAGAFIEAFRSKRQT